MHYECLSVEAALRPELQLAWNRGCSIMYFGSMCFRKPSALVAGQPISHGKFNHSDLAALSREVV
jgi:hypothetical protein